MWTKKIIPLCKKKQVQFCYVYNPKNQWPAHLLHISGFMRSINKIFNLSTKLKYHNSQERDKGGCDLQCHKPQGGPWLHVLLYSLDKVINIIRIVSFVKLNLQRKIFWIWRFERRLVPPRARAPLSIGRDYICLRKFIRAVILNSQFQRR